MMLSLKQKNKILQEFLDSNIKIISQEKLIKYIEYCLYKNKNKRIKNKDGYNKTSYHHILPKSLFGMYKNLKQNSWNGTYLLYSDHYYAHWLLTEAIEDYGQLEAFCKMHNCDMKLGRISESDLISSDEFQRISESSYKLREIELKKEYIDEEGNATTKRKEMAKNRKITIKKDIILEDGTITSIAKEGAKKGVVTRRLTGADKIASEKRHKTMLETDGYSISARKSAETRTTDITLEDGTITSIAKEAIKVRDETMQEMIIHNGIEMTKEELRIMNISIGMKKEIIIEGKITTPAKEAVRKMRETITEEIVLEDGTISSIAKESGKKFSHIVNKEFINEDGIITTKAREIGKKSSETKIKKGRFFNILNVFTNKFIKKNVPEKILIEMYPTLSKMTKDKYLGLSSRSRNLLIKRNQEYMIGWYTEEITKPINKDKEEIL